MQVTRLRTVLRWDHPIDLLFIYSFFIGFLLGFPLKPLWILGMMSMGVVPICAGLAIYIGMWAMATKVGKQNHDDGHTEKGLPMRWHHLQVHTGFLDFHIGDAEVMKHCPWQMMVVVILQRGYMQLFLFSFAPVTRRCAELLMCRTLPINGGITDRLVSDLSLECWTGPHAIAAIISVSIYIRTASTNHCTASCKLQPRPYALVLHGPSVATAVHPRVLIIGRCIICR